MAPKPKQPPGEPMDLGNMRKLGVRSLDVMCLNPDCRHQVVMNVDRYPDYTLVESFSSKMICVKCGRTGADARPNWKEQPVQMSLTGKPWR
jgi:hypothetical protein